MTQSAECFSRTNAVIPEASHPLLDHDPDALKCPQAFFGQLRREAPVVWLPQITAFAVTRLTDIATVLRQPEVFSSSNVMGPDRERQMIEAVTELLTTSPEFGEVLIRAQPGAAVSLLNADPPLHRRQRALVNAGFTPRRINDLAPMIQRFVDELIDGFIEDGQIDLVARFTVPLPLRVIADRLGVPESDLPRFKEWSDQFVASVSNQTLTPDVLKPMITTMAEFYDYFATLIEARRRIPTGDLLSVVANAEIDGDRLEMPELLNMTSQFLVAGSESTTKLLGSACRYLLEDRALYRRLMADPAVVPNFIEEMLRLESPVQGAFRLATQDTEVGGVPVPSGSALWLIYAAGNRDASAFNDPDEVVIERESRHPHLAFGYGEHFCLGAALARLQARIALETLLRRLENLKLAPGNTFEYEPSYFMRGLKRLDVTFTPGQGL